MYQIIQSHWAALEPVVKDFIHDLHKLNLRHANDNTHSPFSHVHEHKMKQYQRVYKE